MPRFVKLSLLTILFQNAVENDGGFGVAVVLINIAKLRKQTHYLCTVIGRLLGTLLTQQVVKLWRNVLLNLAEIVIIPSAAEAS